MTVLPSNILVATLPLLLLVASSEALILPATEECDPNQAEFRMVSTANGICGWDRHCVLDGQSSLGGYCIANDHASAQMIMPQAPSEPCSICKHEGHTSKVTKPHDIVGHYHCSELDGLGKEGKIPLASCQIFQHLVQYNDLCGCTDADDETEEQDETVLFGRDQGENSAPDMPSSDTENYFLDDSGSSSKAISITGVASAITLLLTMY